VTDFPIYTDADLIREGNRIHRIGTDEEPELVPLGIHEVDEETGGLDLKTCGIIAAATKVGKSSVMLRAMYDSPVKVGCISLEDPASVLAARLATLHRDIHTQAIRRNTLNKDEAKALLALPDQLQGKTIFCPARGATVLQMVDLVKALADEGCRMIWLDHIQMFRGSESDRRNEVADAWHAYQTAISDNLVAGMAISQLARGTSRTTKPRSQNMKESGELENESRLTLGAWRSEEVPKGSPQPIAVEVLECTHGGEGARVDYVRTPNGALYRADELPAHLRLVEDF